MPLPRPDAAKLIARRHPEWAEHWRAWRKLADSLEGGHRYQFADYTVPPDAAIGGARGDNPFASAVAGWPAAQATGPSASGGADPATGLVAPFAYGSVVDRNLVPHANEMGADGRDLYLLRLARTPPPTELARVVEAHLARVFGQEVRREGPTQLEAWWRNVDGAGTPVRRWVEDEVAPLLLALGQIDLVVDHPAPPPGTAHLADRALTRRDLIDLGLAGAIASIVLPENVLWWRLDARRRYAEVLTLDRADDGSSCYLHWHGQGVDAYTPGGDPIPSRSRPYAYGAPPIRRVFDRRKVRCRNVGWSRYEGVANKARAKYNARSERILADVLHSHPQLQGPSDLLEAGAEIPIGPGGCLPMAALKGEKGFTTGFAGWEFLDPPTGSQESLRQHVVDLDDEIDREASIAKPAGIAGGSSVSQSGVSKAFDQKDGDAVLARVAEVLEGAERAVAELVLTVLEDAPPTPDALDSVRIEYPKTFGLWAAEDLGAALQLVQAGIAQAGELPATETALLQRLAGVALVGAEEEVLAACRDEIRARVEGLADRRRDEESAPRIEPGPPADPATGTTTTTMTDPDPDADADPETEVPS